MELKITKWAIPEETEFNYEELKTAITEKAEHYKTMVYTENDIPIAKADRATLNKLKKALNDERISREKEYLKPFAEFNAKINNLISIIDEPLLLIDMQVKDYENTERQKKHSEIEKIYTELNPYEWLGIGHIFNEKWLNVSVKLPAIKKEIAERIEQIKSDLETLSKLSEFSYEAIEEYKITLNLNRAIAEGQRQAEIQAKKAEALKQAEEQKEMPCMPQPPKPEAEAEVKRKWIGFNAYLSESEALKLAEFLKSNNIQYKKI